LLDTIDAVDIVTPPETHFALASACLPKVHVFVEKPLAMHTSEAMSLKKQAEKSQHILMVGHIFRFHPAMIRLREILKSIKERPHYIQSIFINPTEKDNGREVELEMLHPFDMVDYLLGEMPTRKHVDDKGRIKVVSLTYARGTHAVFKIGWSGKEKKRTLKIVFKRQTIM
jgi:predicted dehydrogenase